MGKKVLAIFGAGGHGKCIKELADSDNMQNHKWDEIIFIDDKTEKKSQMGSKIMGLDDAIKKYGINTLEFSVAVGEPRTKGQIYQRLQEKGCRFTNVISPEATISPSAVLGVGLTIQKGVIIFPEAVIGDNTCLQAYCTVGHGVSIGCHNQLSTKASIGGDTKIGSYVFVGLNAVIREQIAIGDWCIVAAGAFVLRDVVDHSVVMGNPARIIFKNSEEENVFRGTRESIH